MFIALIAALLIAAPAPQSVTPADAANATYKIQAYIGNPLAGGLEAWSGTAWKVTDNVIITAGHVCGDTPEIVQFRVINERGQSWPATFVKADYDDPTWTTDGPDLCSLTVEHLPGAPLRLAHELPEYGTPVFSVGAAFGVWGPERPLFRGWYGGGNYMTLGGGGGASGSAVLTKDGVIGVLIAGIPGADMRWFIPVDTLRAFLLE